MKLSKNLKIIIATISILVISAAILITGLFFWSYDPYSDPQDRSSELYRSEKIGFSVEVDMTMDEVEESKESIRFSNRGSSQIEISKKNYSSWFFSSSKGESFNSVVDEYKECRDNIENCSFEEYRDILTVETFELNGRKAVRVEGTTVHPFSIDPYSLTEVIIDNDDNYYVLELSYSTDIPERKRKDIFDKAVDSFEII
jgi:hypothetical protein